MTRAGVSPAEKAHSSSAGDAPRSGTEPTPARFLESRPWLVDVFVALLYTVPLLVSRSLGIAAGAPGITGANIVAVLLTGVALLFRRRAPLVVLAVVALLTTVLTWSLDGDNELLAVPVALYAVAVYRGVRVAWLSGGVAFLVAAAGLQAWSPYLPFLPTPPGSDAGAELNLLALFTLSCLVALLLGVAAAGRAQRLRALVERADQLSRERDNLATIAVLAERSRIAREMHDIVAHSVSVMVALADGAAVAMPRDPARATHALEQLSAVGRSALGDMQRLLSVLGDAPAQGPGGGTEDQPATVPGGAGTSVDGALHPTPGYRDLADLVDRFRTAGLPVRWSTTGVPTTDPARELAVYRIAQEALTNALRYAVEPTAVVLAVEHTPDGTIVSVTDDGVGHGPGADPVSGPGPAGPGAAGSAAAARPSVGSRRGLLAMAERAALHGGTVEAGPLPGGGWRVRAMLPRATGDPAVSGSRRKETA